MRIEQLISFSFIDFDMLQLLSDGHFYDGQWKGAEVGATITIDDTGRYGEGPRSLLSSSAWSRGAK